MADEGITLVIPLGFDISTSDPLRIADKHWELGTGVIIHLGDYR